MRPSCGGPSSLPPSRPLSLSLSLRLPGPRALGQKPNTFRAGNPRYAYNEAFPSPRAFKKRRRRVAGEYRKRRRQKGEAQVEGTGNIRFTRRDACLQCTRPDFARTISLRLWTIDLYAYAIVFEPNALCVRYISLRLTNVQGNMTKSGTNSSRGNGKFTIQFVQRNVSFEDASFCMGIRFTWHGKTIEYTYVYLVFSFRVLVHRSTSNVRNFLGR